MSQKLTDEKINSWRERLQEIGRLGIEQDVSICSGPSQDVSISSGPSQKEQLQELAREVGASTRAIGFEDGKPYGYDASIAELTDNINQAIQTATIVKNSADTRRSIFFTIVAVFISFVALILGAYFSNKNVSIAQEANKISSTALTNSYIPWLQVTSVEPVFLDQDRLEIRSRCRNYTNAPALELCIKYNIISDDGLMADHTLTDVNSPLMPNYEGEFNCIITKKNQAGKLLEKINNRQASVRFDIHFKDIFGNNIVVHQDTECAAGKYRIISYKVDGIDALFKEID